MGDDGEWRFGIGETVWCHVHPEGWIQAAIVARGEDEMAYRMSLIYNDEEVSCPVDSFWFVRSEEPAESEVVQMEANRSNKVRRFAVEEEVVVCRQGEWVEGVIEALNEEIEGRQYPYRVYLHETEEEIHAGDGSQHVRRFPPNEGMGPSSQVEEILEVVEAVSVPKEPRAAQGWLSKKGGGQSLLGRRNWTRRFFRLRKATLSYASDEKGDAKKTIQLVPKDGVCAQLDLIRDGKELHLEISRPERTWRIRFEDNDGPLTLQQWEYLLGQHIEYYQYLKENGGS